MPPTTPAGDCAPSGLPYKYSKNAGMRRIRIRKIRTRRTRFRPGAHTAAPGSLRPGSPAGAPSRLPQAATEAPRQPPTLPGRPRQPPGPRRPDAPREARKKFPDTESGVPQPLSCAAAPMFIKWG